MLCAQCGHTNPAGSRFCSACGSSLDAPRATSDDTRLIPVTAPDAQEEELAVSSGEVPAGQGVLVVKRGPNAGSRYVLEGSAVTAGRSPDSDIFLDDVTVSRRHASFVPSGPSYEVRDVGSLNGTYLNRERIDAAPLSNGDEVQIGKFRLVFLSGPAT
ncbi:MAG: FHA domain-containing protein [Acidimicrobiales bacterium]